LLINENGGDEGLLFEVYFKHNVHGHGGDEVRSQSEMCNRNLVPRGKKRLVEGEKGMAERERGVFSQMLAMI
jgi:hypothetical protein